MDVPGLTLGMLCQEVLNTPRMDLVSVEGVAGAEHTTRESLEFCLRWAVAVGGPAPSPTGTLGAESGELQCQPALCVPQSPLEDSPLARGLHWGGLLEAWTSFPVDVAHVLTQC